MKETVRLGVIDYGVGNLGSILNMSARVGLEAQTVRAVEDAAQVTHFVLPGVGAFDAGMQRLQRSGLIPVLEERVRHGGAPLLGICLGMQLLTRGSEEGTLPGLGWVNATTKRFVIDSGRVDLKVPHMGWNVVRPVKTSPLFEGWAGEVRFYFLHSYYVCCESPSDVLAEASHGLTFTAGFQVGSVVGAQFHPEKSHRFGMEFLRRFGELRPSCDEQE